jgi:hypothetical protein
MLRSGSIIPTHRLFYLYPNSITFKYIFMTVYIQKKMHQVCLMILALFIFASCQKTLDDIDVIIPNNETPDLVTKVNSSVSGFVTDENNAAVLGASVKVGIATATTDKYGYFEIRNTDVVKNAATVTVSKPGYFKGIKTYIASANKSAFFRIKLIPKTTAGTISSTTGGNVTLSNGLIVSLPIDAVVNAGSGAAYSGVINVAAHWIDPTANDLNSTMPGDLRALNASGALKILQTYGMAAVELTGAGGELLQIATGKKATLTFPVPAALSATAPNTIPLWYFDEGVGLWKEDGTATKTGSTYVGDVSHFSFWNCDVPNNYVQFSCTILDPNGQPIPNTLVKISVVSNPWNAGYGWTDSSGYVAGAVPDNQQLQLDVLTGFYCGTSIYSQTFSTTNTNIALGNITVPVGSVNWANVTGTISTCTMGPVTNGYLIMLKGFQYYRYATDNTGAYDFSTALCNGNEDVTFIAEDAAATQQSTPLIFTLTNGSNTVGNIQACGVTTQEFANYSIDGGALITYTAPGDTIYQSGNGTSANFIIGGYNTMNSNSFNFSVDNMGIALNSQQQLLSFQHNQNPLVPATTVLVTITEYGTVGQFIAGNFSGSFSSTLPPYTSTVSCNFRVRRVF